MNIKATKFFIKFLINQKFYGKALKNLFKQGDDKQTLNPNDQIILDVSYSNCLLICLYIFFIVIFFQCEKLLFFILDFETIKFNIRS